MFGVRVRVKAAPKQWVYFVSIKDSYYFLVASTPQTLTISRLSTTRVAKLYPCFSLSGKTAFRHCYFSPSIPFPEPSFHHFPCYFSPSIPFPEPSFHHFPLLMYNPTYSYPFPFVPPDINTKKNNRKKRMLSRTPHTQKYILIPSLSCNPLDTHTHAPHPRKHLNTITSTRKKSPRLA